MQLVPRRVMDESVKTTFKVSSQDLTLQIQPLTGEEEQALHYEAGYVPF